MKKKYILIAMGLFVILFIIGNFIYETSLKNDFQKLYFSGLRGKIVSLYSSSGGDRFQLDNSGIEYRFFPIVGSLNHEKGFSITAQIGDSIFKEPSSDTLVLIKKYPIGIYKYIFK